MKLNKLYIIISILLLSCSNKDENKILTEDFQNNNDEPTAIETSTDIDGELNVATIEPSSPFYPLKESILGILGIGRIGAALAKKASAFGMKLIAFDPFADDLIFKKLKAQKVTLQQLLKKSDYLSLHAPYTKKNGRNYSKENSFFDEK